jgi:hypothetical protein
VLDDDLLALLAERIQGTRKSPRGPLIALVNEMEGVPRREVLERYPLDEVVKQLQEQEDLWRCGECQIWTRATKLVESRGNEPVCYDCRPDLARRDNPDFQKAASSSSDDEDEEPDSAEARSLDEELRSFLPGDDDRDESANDAMLNIRGEL